MAERADAAAAVALPDCARLWFMAPASALPPIPAMAIWPKAVPSPAGETPELSGVEKLA